MKKSNDQRLSIAIVLALTLGLAPFTPEPHIFGKIKWIISGANGMQPMDYFDVFLHGAPWLFLVVVIFKRIQSK